MAEATQPFAIVDSSVLVGVHLAACGVLLALRMDRRRMIAAQCLELFVSGEVPCMHPIVVSDLTVLTDGSLG